MSIKKRSFRLRVLLCIFIFSFIDQPWLEKTRATIAEEVAVVGLASAGVMRAVACAGLALYRALTQSSNSGHNHSATQTVHARKVGFHATANNYSTQVSATSSQTISENHCKSTGVLTHPSSIATDTTISSTAHRTTLSTNGTAIAQVYVNSLSQKDRTIAEQTAHTITGDWNNSVRANVVQNMCSRNYNVNCVVPGITRWTQSSYAITTQPGGGTIHFGDGFGQLRWGSATHYKADRTAILHALNVKEERCAINHNQECYSHIKQLIDNFVENGKKLVYGSEAERIIALLHLPYFYFSGISYGQELACAQQELYAHYFHEDDGSICLNALKNTNAAQKILHNYTRISHRKNIRILARVCFI